MGSTAEKRRFTYADYRNWPDEERWEIIDGEAYNMTPAPGLRHHKVLGNLHVIFHAYLKGKQCRPFIAPTDAIFEDAESPPTSAWTDQNLHVQSASRKSGPEYPLIR